MAYTSLGAINLTAGGTRQRITTSNIKAAEVTFKAVTASSGPIYIGDATLVKATYVGVFITLEQGESWTTRPGGKISNPIHLDDFYFDGTTDDDILVSYVQV